MANPQPAINRLIRSRALSTNSGSATLTWTLTGEAPGDRETAMSSVVPGRALGFALGGTRNSGTMAP